MILTYCSLIRNFFVSGIYYHKLETKKLQINFDLKTNLAYTTCKLDSE